MSSILSAAALAGGMALIVSATPADAGGVIKGGTVIITPGAVQSNLGNIRTTSSPAGLILECAGGTTYTVSTGTKAGTCNVKTDNDGGVELARCEDNAGNVAAMSCPENDGKGACGETAGSGTCTAE